MTTVYVEGIADSLPIDVVTEALIATLTAGGLTVIDARPAKRGGLFLELRNGTEAERAIKLLDGAVVERRRIRAAPARSGWSQ